MLEKGTIEANEKSFVIVPPTWLPQRHVQPSTTNRYKNKKNRTLVSQ